MIFNTAQVMVFAPKAAKVNPGAMWSLKVMMDNVFRKSFQKSSIISFFGGNYKPASWNACCIVVSTDASSSILGQVPLIVRILEKRSSCMNSSVCIALRYSYLYPNNGRLSKLSLIETFDGSLNGLTMLAPTTLGRVPLNIEPESNWLERLAGFVMLAD